jgi:hypothetical protein
MGELLLTNPFNEHITHNNAAILRTPNIVVRKDILSFSLSWIVADEALCRIAILEQHGEEVSESLIASSRSRCNRRMGRDLGLNSGIQPKF